MKVAFCTQDLKQVDAHFGWAKNIAIYEVGSDSHQFVEAIKDCAILYVAAIGGSGAARVVANNIHPIKVNQPEPIAEILEKLKAVLAGNPPPWLRKVMRKGEARTFDFEDADEEIEHG